jgi:hypothetical protein
MYGIISSSLLKIGSTEYGYEMRVRGQGKRPSRGYAAVYPDSTNKTKLTTAVKVTLKTTLASNQNWHPLPIL